MQDRVTQPMAVRVGGVKKTVTLSLTVAGWFGLCAAAPACRAADVPPAADQVVVHYREALQNDQDSPVLGDPHGDVTIVEFFDYACSYCKAVEPRLESALRSDPHVKLILKEFPILTPESLIAARLPTPRLVHPGSAS